MIDFKKCVVALNVKLKIKIHMNYTWICEDFAVFILSIFILCLSVIFLHYKYKIYMHGNNTQKQRFSELAVIFYSALKNTVMVKSIFLIPHSNLIYWFQYNENRMKNARNIEITFLTIWKAWQWKNQMRRIAR